MLSLLLVLFQLRLSLTSSFPSCHLPAGAPGLCVPIGQCQHLTSLLGNLQPPITKDVGLIIRESFFCGKTDGVVQVCCQVQGIVADRWVLYHVLNLDLL